MSHRFKCTTEAEIKKIKREELASVEEVNVRELTAQVVRLKELSTELEGPVATRPLQAARLAMEQAITCLDIPAAEPSDWEKILADLQRAEDNLQDRVKEGDEEAISTQATIGLLRGILHLFLGPEGEQGALLDRTVSMLDDVEMMPILTRPAFSEDWVQLWRVDRIETTIEACKKALELLKIDAHLSNARRAVANITLGNAYFDRVRGDRSNNLRLAIEYLEEGVGPGGKDRDRFPRQWALAQQSLGNCYAWNQDFDKAEEHYREAWSLQFDHGFGEDAATTLNNRGIALVRKWVKRAQEVSADHMPKELWTLPDIKDMEQKLEFAKLEAVFASFDSEWSAWEGFRKSGLRAYQAVTSYNLGRVREIRADHVRALGDLFLGREDMREAGQAGERPRETSEEEGGAEERPRETSEEEREAEERRREAEERYRKASGLEEEAATCYQRALGECILQKGEDHGERRHSFQLVELVAARRLGRLHFKRGAWKLAGESYKKAIDVLEKMRGEYITDLGRYALARQNANLYTEMAFVCCRLAEDGDWDAPWLAKEEGELSRDDVYKTALEYLEHGLARLLTEMLVRHDAAPRVAVPEKTRAPKTLKKLREDFVRRRNEIRRLESILRNYKEKEGEQISQTVEALLKARNAFDQTVAAIQKRIPDFVVIPDVLEGDEIVDVVPWDVRTALVYFAITEWGTRVFVVTRPDVGQAAASSAGPASANPKVTEDGTLHIFSLDFTRDDLHELLFKAEGAAGRWWQTYQDWQRMVQAGKSDPSLEDRWNDVKSEMEHPPDCVEAGWFVVYQLHKVMRREFRQLWRDTIEHVTENLYPGLLAEVDSYLKDSLGCERIIFVPQLGLRLLPLHALRDQQGEYLIERYEDIAYAPSAATLQGCRSRLANGPQRTHFLGVAVGADQAEEKRFEEVIADIAGFFTPRTTQPGTQPVLTLPGDKAKEEDVVRAARDRNFIAFECHGEFNLNDPWKSSLQLGGDDRLELHEVYDKVDLPQTRVVTLGACESGLVDHTRPGSEFIGLPGGFLYAGAPAVIGSLWRVEEQATADLMVGIYKNVQKFGMQPSAALCQAQRAMLQSELHCLPYYWAPFYLCGGSEGWWP
jgi:CHAT domain-containing protein/tetratricopeptide (TPR) repeat protein